MRRFVIAFGTTVHSFGRHPFYKRAKVEDFCILFNREDYPGQWS